MPTGMKLDPDGLVTKLSGRAEATAWVNGRVGDTTPARLQAPMHWQVGVWLGSEGLESWC